DIDDEKIKPKVSEPIYFDFPVYKPKAKKQPKAKPTQKEQPMQKEQNQDSNDDKNKYMHNLALKMEKIEENIRNDMIKKYGTFELEAMLRQKNEKYKKLYNDFKKKYNLTNKKDVEDVIGNINFMRQLQNNNEYQRLKKEWDNLDY
ncbi:MAG TPA: hypothetical protein V6C58_23145, partial [Allocoleopsis sp.]